MNAFKEVLSKRQSKYTELLIWIEGKINDLYQREGGMSRRLEDIVKLPLRDVLD